MIAILIGSTGPTGSSLVRQLLADPEITKVTIPAEATTEIAFAMKWEHLFLPLITLGPMAAKSTFGTGWDWKHARRQALDLLCLSYEVLKFWGFLNQEESYWRREGESNPPRPQPSCLQ